MQLPSRFYAMIDPTGGHQPLALARILVDEGARILQLRLKEFGAGEFLALARQITSLCHERGALLIVNDRADIAKLADADGVHVGQEDLPLDAARSLMGPDKIVGLSTHSVEQARAAEEGGADYIGFGAIYSGGSKNVKHAQGLERLRAVRAAVKIPIVAIGGITEATIGEVLAAGADAAAIISDVAYARDPRAKIRALLAARPRI
jgi:thiamine-phosphate diphosphorylase